MLQAKSHYNWIQEVHLVLHSNILFAANLQRDLKKMIWSKASGPTGWSNKSLFVTQKDVTFPQLLQFSSWRLYVPPKFCFPVGNWIPQTVNQTWKNIAILNLNLSKSSTPQNVAATPFFSWKTSWSFGDWDDWGPKKSAPARNPQHSDPPKSHPKSSRICSIHFGNVLVEAKATPFRFLKAESPTKTEPNLWCFRFLWGSSHFLEAYGMIRPMFMLEEKMIPNNLANIPSMSVFQDGASQFFWK